MSLQLLLTVADFSKPYFYSMPNTKRSKRVGMNLTPEQNEQLQQAAERMGKTPTRYAYDLLVCALDNPALLPAAAPAKRPVWEDKLAEVYGLLDAIAQSLDDRLEPSEERGCPSSLQPLLEGVNVGIAEAQQTLLMICQLLSQEQA